MKKNICIVILLICLVNQAQAHIFPKNDLNPQYPIPKNEFIYIRIIPSSVMEGFVSYELCPLIQGENKDKYLLYTERQHLRGGDYHHDLILSDCKRPYQLNPVAPKVYFDLRDLDQALNRDDDEKRNAMIAALTVSVAAGMVTGGMVSGPLLGFVVSSSGMYVGYKISDPIADQMFFIHKDWYMWSRVEYFMGDQIGFGSDLFWEVQPKEIPTFGECYSSCQVEEAKRYEKEKKSEAQKMKDLRYDDYKKQMSQHSETTNSMSPFYGKNPCQLQCQYYSAERYGMHQIWKDLYLDTIYRAGNVLDTDDSKKLNQYYDDPKHFKDSAWEIVREKAGQLVPNHYTHKADEESGARKPARYYLCDYVRRKAYKKYQSKGGTLRFKYWLKQKCEFSDDMKCRDYYDSDIQSGEEICTVLMD